MLYQAKTLVTYNEILRQPGEKFEVSEADARKNGWDVENNTVQPAQAPEQSTATAEETPAPTAPEVTPEVTPEATEPVTPEPTAPEQPEVAQGEGDNNQA